ncbi:MAG: NUDIX hydrolase [Acidimicrobiia bacterium]|nr:NUDIX hydrolase [Acidimicrobiia bacterium]NNL27129.1 NUDIX hydrolase [Acidimicrobiia bacterium]
MAVDASSVLLLKDYASQVAVFMLERHIDSDFVGGAYVFPGGKVDESDAAVDRWIGISPDVEADRFGCSAEIALALHVAAVRETFEEAGVLLATRAGEPVEPEFLQSRSSREVRIRMASRTEAFDWRPWLAEHDLVLTLDRLSWWSWWVTPEGLPKRFDTRFFVAEMPMGQIAQHDGIEATDARWLVPNEALEAAAAGEIEIILPTRRNLVDIGQFPSVEMVLREARGRNPNAIIPSIVPFEGGLAVDHHSFEGPETV